MSKVKFIALTMAVLSLLLGAVALAVPPSTVWVGTPLQPGAFWNYNQFKTIDSGVVEVAVGGTVNVLPGTYVLASTINVNKAMTIDGAGVTTVVQVANPIGYAFNISASGVTLRDIKLQKTDGTGPHYLIMVSANNVSILNNTILGPAPTLPWSYTSCGINVAGGLTGLLIDNNTIQDLRFPADIAALTVGTVSNNAVSKSDGWLNSGDITFTGNSWSATQAADIKLFFACETFYPDLIALSNANNNAYIDASLFTIPNQGRAVSNIAPPTTIAAGVAATLATGTLNLAPGTYTSGFQVVISRDLTIVGNVARTATIITPTASTGNTGDARGWFLVNAGAVFNLSGVTLDGSGFMIWQGIRMHGSGTINNNIIKNIGYNPSGPDYAGTGIATFGDNGTVISNNAFSGIGRVGVLFFGVTGTYTGNSYTGKGTGDFLDYGVELGAGAVVDVIGNTFTACRGVASVDGSTSAGAAATTFYGAGTDGDIQGNTFTDSYAGIDIGYGVADASIVTVTNNNMFDGNDYGITTAASPGIVLNVVGNEFRNSAIIGLDNNGGPAGVVSNIFCCGNTQNASEDNAGSSYNANYWSDWSGVVGSNYPVPGAGARIDYAPSTVYGLDMTPDVVNYNVAGSFNLKVNIEKCVIGLNAADIWLEYPVELSVSAVAALDGNFTVYYNQTTNPLNTRDTVKVQLGVMTGTTSGPDELFQVTFNGAGSCIPLGSDIRMIYRDLRDNSGLPNSILAPLASPTTFTSNPPTITVLSPAGLLPTGGFYNVPPVLNLSAAYSCDLNYVRYSIDNGSWVYIATGLTGTTWNAAWSMTQLVFDALADNTLHNIRFRVNSDDGRNNADYLTYRWYFTKDVTPPAAPTNLVAAPGHNKVHLSWTNPPVGPLTFDHAIVMRTDWCSFGHAYPLYALSLSPFDIEGPYPTVVGMGDQVYSGPLASKDDNFDLSNATRDIYHYAVFAVDEAGNVSPASVGAKSTSYWLGDMKPTYDGYVKVEDLGAFASTYGLMTGNTGFNAEVDFAPTVPLGVAKGIPTPDGVINFEELSIFAINYGDVLPTGKPRPTLPGFAIQSKTGLRVAERMTTTTFDVDLYLDNRDDMAKSLLGELTYDPTMLEYVSTVAGQDLMASQLPVFFKALTSPNQISVSAAVLGNGISIEGSGLIATLSFRVLGPGKTTVQLSKVDIRDNDNRSLVSETIQLPGTEAVADVPTTYEIEQNRPNPFNPETVIKYALPNATQVSIRIYNIVGQLVNTLVDDYQPAGQHQVVWNGTNENGERVASGIYLYRFVTPDHQQTLKMTLLK